MVIFPTETETTDQEVKMTAATNISVNPIEVTSSSDEIVEHIRLLQNNEDIRIGALRNLECFYAHTAHVICFVQESEDSTEKYPKGICAYMIITKNGPVGIELCQTLNKFWGYWRWQGEAIFPDIETVLSEIEYFFQYANPRHTEDYKFEDGLQNQRTFREMRSVEKCNQLKSIFGFNLVPVA